MFGKVQDAKSGLMFHQTNAEDPFITEADGDVDMADEELDAINVRLRLRAVMLLCVPD